MEEKVYVAIGSDLQDGFGTLEWALKKWYSHSISIVILHAANNTSKDYVYTPFGKLPASSVSDEKLDVLKKCEQEKIDKNMANYIAFCAKSHVKAEILEIKKYEEPMHKVIVELVSGIRITKLVMGISFMKSSGKSRSGISGSFYVHRNKPDFCELFIICGGKLVFLKGENSEEIIEDDKGVMVAKLREKASFKGWIGKMFPENSSNQKNLNCSPPSSMSNDLPDQWEKNVEEIENYFHQLVSSNSDDEDGEVEDEMLHNISTEPVLPENMSGAEKIEALKIKIRKAHEAIQLRKKEAKANVDKHAKAKWAICLSIRRVEELEARISEEIASRIDLKKDLDTAKDELHDIQSEIVERNSKLSSILELQRELSDKLHSFSLTKSRYEAQLEKAVHKRANMVQEIEEFRRQRDVMHRRIEFCREKDAIGMATRLNESGFNYRMFTADEIRVATDDFSECLRLKSMGDWTNVYRGRINHTTVAIKLYDSLNASSQEAFPAKMYSYIEDRNFGDLEHEPIVLGVMLSESQYIMSVEIQVKLLSHIRHPHLVAVLGFCSELCCIVYEYMHNGCLRDTLFSAHRSSKRRNQSLNWHARIRIAAEISSGLGFLHQAQPRPIIHGNLNPSKILLDRNNVAKIHGFRLAWSYDESDITSDIHSLGNMVIQLLTGRNWAGLVEEAVLMDRKALVGVLDPMAGEWPLNLAVELARIAVQCLSTKEGLHGELKMALVMRQISGVKKKADDLVEVGECRVGLAQEGVDMEESSIVPSVFLCPIFQDVMKDPHVAADGFSYDLEAIEEWLRTGHDTSPMTNLKLNHKHLTPNHTLRSLIQDWHNKRAIPL